MSRISEMSLGGIGWWVGESTNFGGGEGVGGRAQTLVGASGGKGVRGYPPAGCGAEPR